MVHPSRLPVLTSMSFRIGNEPVGGSPGQLFWVKISRAIDIITYNMYITK